jgi:hypothetical protein
VVVEGWATASVAASIIDEDSAPTTAAISSFFMESNLYI